MTLLLSRVGMASEGGRAAQGRRQWEMAEGWRMSRQREAAWQAETTGRQIIRRGQYWLR